MTEDSDIESYVWIGVFIAMAVVVFGLYLKSEFELRQPKDVWIEFPISKHG